MQTQMPSTAGDSTLYRRVWRWHFYAGLVCLPFLALLAVTGGLYLFKDPIDSIVYARLLCVEPTTSPSLDAESLVARARAAVPGEAVRFIRPSRAGRSAEVGVRTVQGTMSVYLDPATGRVLGHLRDDSKLMEVIKRTHSLTIAGSVANYWVEVVAGWAIVLVASGLFLWWPRGRSGGVYSVRGRPAQRTWWRDLHAVTGVVAAAAILFLAVTGLPWSAFWGKEFGRLTNQWGIGLPGYLWGAPKSSPPVASLGDVPWSLAQASVPRSMPHEGHASHETAPTPGPAAAAAPSIGLNQALRTFDRLGLPAGTPVRFPSGPQGVYSAMSMPDDVTRQRVVHLDRYTGAVLADVGYRDYGVAGRAVEWGINLHTGRQFGWVNQLVMLAGCLSIVTLAVTAAVMWWKRRPAGRLSAPARQDGDRVARTAIAVAVVLGLLYPLLGASMLAAAAIDFLLPRTLRVRFGL